MIRTYADSPIGASALAADAAIGATGLTLAADDLPASLTANFSITVGTGAGSESLTVQTRTGTALTLTAPTTKVHSAGDAVDHQLTAADAASWQQADDVTAAIAAIDFPVDSVNGQTGVVELDKSDVGLGSVDNTADSAKPVSTAQQTALDGKADKTRPLAGAVAGSYWPSNDEFDLGSGVTLGTAISNSLSVSTLEIGKPWTSNFTAIDPLPSPFTVKIDNEFFLVSYDEASNSCKIHKRGLFGGGRAAHSAGATAYIGIMDDFWVATGFPTIVGNLYFGRGADTPARVILPSNDVMLTAPSGGAGNLYPPEDGEAHIVTLECNDPSQIVEVYEMTTTNGAINPDPTWRGSPATTPGGTFQIMLLMVYTQQNGARWLISALGDAAGILTGQGDPNGVGLYSGLGTLYRRLDGGTGTCLYVKETDYTSDTGWVAK